MDANWTEGDVSVNGNAIHYVRTGEGTKPCMVLVHGHSDNGLCWTRMARELQGAYDIVMPDARGHGRSARVKPGEHLDQTGDLAGFMRQMGMAQCIVAGHSMGGWMASELAARYPDLVRALILEDPPWRDPAPGAEGRALLGKDSPRATAMRALHRQSLDEIVRHERAVHPTWDDETLRLWCAAKLKLDLAFYETSRARMDWREVAKAIGCPTLLITANPTLGGIVTPEIAAEAVELNPLIELVAIPSAGHHVRFEAYEAYREAWREFLSGVAP